MSATDTGKVMSAAVLDHAADWPRPRVVGATVHSRMDRYAFRQASRGLQIGSDVVRRCPNNWLAIDDDVDGWPAWCTEQLVGSDEALGISEPGVRRMLVQKLEAPFGGGGR